MPLVSSYIIHIIPKKDWLFIVEFNNLSSFELMYLINKIHIYEPNTTATSLNHSSKQPHKV